MSLENLLKLAKILEKKRDMLLASNEILVPYFIFILFNTFFFVYVESLKEAAKTTEDLRDNYWKSRFTSLRYLCELYLTTAHILNKNGAERDTTVVSLALHQRAYLHRINLEIHKADPTSQTQSVLDNDAEGYKATIQKFPLPWNQKLPPTLEELPTPNSPQWKNLGLRCYTNNKITYTGAKGEIFTNVLVRQTIGLSFKKAPLERLNNYYQLLSMQGHPTLETLEDYNGFERMDSAGRERLIKDQKEKFNYPVLQILGEAMVRLADIAIENLK